MFEGWVAKMLERRVARMLEGWVEKKVVRGKGG